MESFEVDLESVPLVAEGLVPVESLAGEVSSVVVFSGEEEFEEVLIPVEWPEIDSCATP